ncbi:MAG: outer membrane beta-barrel protein [Alphaproteobacteria bacterium]|nr:outer membrane beta-barrel protein [Alphaproteobacteria bacterium]
MWGSRSDRILRARAGLRPRLLAVVGMGAGFACALAAQASAQEFAPEYLYSPEIFGEDIPRGETVRNRPRPEVDALGLHLGGFYLFPSVTNGISYNDNVFAADNDATSDFIYTLEPQIAVRSDWNRHAIGLAAGGRFGFYFDETGENYQDAFATASGKLDISSSSLMRSTLGIRREHEERGDPNDVAGAEPTVFYNFSGGLEGSHRFNRVTISAGGDVRRYDYEDVDAQGGGTIDQDDRDRMQYRPGVKVAYELIPGYAAFVRAEGDIRRYDESVDNEGANRDSQGYDVVGGAALDLTGLLFGDVFAGVRQRYFEDSRFETITGPVVGATLTWIPTGLTTVTLKADSEVIESTDINSSGYSSTGVGITVDHELLRNLILSGGGGFRYDDFEGISRTDKFFTLSAGASYLMNRYLSLGARYSYSNRNSNEAGADYDRNLISLLLTAKL